MSSPSTPNLKHQLTSRLANLLEADPSRRRKRASYLSRDVYPLRAPPGGAVFASTASYGGSLLLATSPPTFVAGAAAETTPFRGYTSAAEPADPPASATHLVLLPLLRAVPLAVYHGRVWKHRYGAPLNGKRDSRTVRLLGAADQSEVLALLAEDGVESVAAELAGGGSWSLTADAGPPRLVPLYQCLSDGRVRPCGGVRVPAGGAAAALREALAEDEEANRALGLAEEYECGRFATEGRLAFYVGEDGACVRREAAVAEAPGVRRATAAAEWSPALVARVRRAAAARDLRRAAGVGQLLWRRLGRGAEALAAAVRDPVRREPGGGPVMALTVGLPGAGKSHLAARLLGGPRGARWARVNQDSMGSRRACEDAARRALGRGQCVLVDRTNIDPAQRAHWVRMAAAHGCSRVLCVWLRTPAGVCRDRVLRREGHETLPPTHDSVRVVDLFLRSFVPPVEEEGFDEVLLYGGSDGEEAERVLSSLGPDE